MQVIEHIELDNNSTTSIVFTSGGVWADYTDLFLLLSLRSYSTGALAVGGLMRLNGSSSAEYQNRGLLGSATTVSVEGGTTGTTFNTLLTFPGTTATSGVFGNTRIWFPNINESEYQTVLSQSAAENNGSTTEIRYGAGYWNNNAAITEISIFGTTFAQYSSATLYGITKGSDGSVTIS